MLKNNVFTCFFTKFIITILLFLCVKAKIKEEIENNNDNTNHQLPNCKYINPAKQMKQWDEFDFSKCKILNFEPKNNKDEEEIYRFGEKYYSYNLYVSDMIGSRRNLSHIKPHERFLNIY